MTYLVDTDVLIDFFKLRDQAKELIQRLSSTSLLALSALTVTELRSGWTQEQADRLLPQLYALCSVEPVSKEKNKRTPIRNSRYCNRRYSAPERVLPSHEQCETLSDARIDPVSGCHALVTLFESCNDAPFRG
jgi:hypothetical protein